METILTSVMGALKTLLEMPSILLFALALNVVGWVLKRTALNNKFIPVVIIVLSTIVMPFLIPAQVAGEVPNNVPYPELADWIRRISLGIVLGLVAWGAHAALLKRVEKYLPSLSDDTKPPTAGLLLLAFFAVAGCASAPAYKTLYATGHAADAAVKSYFDLVLAKKVATNGVPQVARAYEKFQTAYRLALAVAEFNPTGPPDTNVTARAQDVLGAVANAKGRLP